VAGVVGSGVAVVGLLMFLVGAGSLFPSAGAWALGPGVVLGAGSAVLLAGFGGLGRRLPSVLDAVTPRLYPFAPWGLNAAVYLVILVAGVSVFSGFFDVFNGAHDGGEVSSIPDQAAVFALVAAASAVVWALTVYAVLVARRVIQLGRGLDSVVGARDVYGHPVPLAAVRLGESARRYRPNPRPALGPAVVYAVTTLLAIPISAGIQVLEVSIDPAPALVWLSGQPFLCLFTLPLAAGFVWADRGLRDVERRALLHLPELDSQQAALEAAGMAEP